MFSDFSGALDISFKISFLAKHGHLAEIYPMTIDVSNVTKMSTFQISIKGTNAGRLVLLAKTNSPQSIE